MQAKFTGRWVPSGNSMTTGYPGSSFSFRVSGTHNVTVETSGSNRVAYKIDNGSYVISSSGTVTITGLTLSTHTIKVVLNTSTSTWTGTNYATVSSITVDQYGEIVATNHAKRRMLVFGDSITQGYMYVIREGYREAPELTYWNKLGELLAADMISCGQGGIGYVKDSDGHYPMLSANPSYIENISSTIVNTDTDFDIIVILLGVNDWKSKTEVDNDYVTAVTGCIERIKAKYPSADIHALIPFNNNGKPSLEQVYNAQGVHIIPQTWYSQITFGDSLHPDDNGHTIIANNLKSYFENYYGSAYFKEVTMKRIDTVYIDTSGEVRKATGTMADSPVKPILPSGAIRVADIVVEQGANTGTIIDNRDWLKIYDNIGIVNVKDYGAKGDGTHDDTAAIQSAIDNNGGKVIFFPAGTYLINSPIKTSRTENERVLLYLSKATIKATSSFPNNYIVYVGINGDDSQITYTHNMTGIVGGTLDGSGKALGGVITNCHQPILDTVYIKDVNKIGVYIGNNTNHGASDAYVARLQIFGNAAGSEVDDDSVGLYLYGTDNNVRDVRTASFTTGIYVLSDGNTITDCHPLWQGPQIQSLHQKGKAFYIKGSMNALNDCYADLYHTAIYVDGIPIFTVNNFFDYSAPMGFDEHYTIRVVNASVLRAYFTNLTLSLATSVDNYGYSGPIMTQDGHCAGFSHVLLANNYSDMKLGKKEPLFYSPLNTDMIADRLTGNDDWNIAVKSGTWAVDNITGGVNNAPPSFGAFTYGRLVVNATPGMYGLSYPQVQQTFYPNDLNIISTRYYFGDGDPISTPTGWSNWYNISVTQA